MGLQIKILPASTSREIDAVFAPFVSERPDALFVAGDAFFTSRRVQLATLAARHMLPMASGTREIVDAGGLMSYGASILDVWRQVGIYVGRVLKGDEARRPPGCAIEQIRADRQSHRLPGPSASLSRHRCSPAPTR